jgi:hypothetical protein
VDPERHRRAQTLFEQAEALPLEKRETLLATIGADDPVLRREVARLLEAAARMAEDFLEPSPTSRATRTRVGETLAHYRILDQLGVGGMGEVYLAEDERLKRRVALKVLPPDLAGNPERLERFQREAETVAALNHPNIVTIYSIENEGGVHFLTMELVEGPTLRRLIDHSGALPIEDVLDLGVQIAEGLAEAHAAGITHRDLKPGNVMVAPNDRVKLLDFGLARADQPFGADAALADPKAEMTKEGAILGTIAYMSPEQVMGRRVSYALRCLLSRDPPLRARHRQASLPGRDRDLDAGEDPGAKAPGSPRGAARAPPGARADRRSMSRKGPHPALPGHGAAGSRAERARPCPGKRLARRLSRRRGHEASSPGADVADSPPPAVC